MLNNLGIIVAARMGSNRLPGKVIKPLLGIPMIQFLLDRIAKINSVPIVLATTNLPQDDILVDIVEASGFEVFRGSADDVADRYILAANHFDFEYVIRITGDCPFLNDEVLTHCIQCLESDFDLATTKGLFPIGIDLEIYKSQLLEKLSSTNQLTQSDREHVTKYFYDHNNDFKINKISPPPKWEFNLFNFTVDTHEDFKRAELIVEALQTPYFSIDTLIHQAKFYAEKIFQI